MKEGKTILFHADDYGINTEQAGKILACYREGVLNSISVIPNSLQIKECLDLLESTDSERHIRRVLHLNFVEGRPAAGADKVPLLVDETGFFNQTFVDILKWNYEKKAYQQRKQQIKLEIAAQLDRVTKENDYHITAIDSHQHYHMIPIVLDALMEVLDQKEKLGEPLKIAEVRIPADPVIPLLRTPEVWSQLPAINMVKWGILRLFAGRTQRILQNRGIDAPVFFGIFFTCEMKSDIVEVLLPKYQIYAKKKNRALELMFHPGSLMARYELLDERSDELTRFYMSENRFWEAECMKKMRRLNGFGLEKE